MRCAGALAKWIDVTGLMASLGVRNIGGYNRKVKDAIDAGKPIPDPTWKPPELEDPEKPVEHPTLTPLPFIVIIIDELADMMMIVGKKVGRTNRQVGAKSTRFRRAHVACDTTPIGRCYYRPDQGKHTEPNSLPGLCKG